MARILRRLTIDSVDSVDKGAGRGTRVILTKRDTGSVMDGAVKALDTSIKSIIDDESVVAKAAPITASVGQFVEYLEKRGVDQDKAEALAADVVAKYAAVKVEKQEEVEVKPESVIAKVDRAVSFGKSLQQTIDDYSREHGVSKSVACDRVILGGGIDLSLSGDLGGPVVKYARLEKSLRSAEDADYGMALAARGDHGVVVRDATITKGDKGKYAAKLGEMSREFHNSEWGKGMTAAQAFDHVSTKTEKGKKLFAKDKAERMGQPVDDSDDGEDVEKTGQKKPKSKFPTMTPQQQQTQLNRPAPGAKVPHQTRTKPLAPGEEEDESLSDPYAELEEKAAALRKQDPSLTAEQAFVKFYENPAHRDLVRKEFRQRQRKLDARAA
jgi:nucleotide-binding universal stress UspA family protein